MLLEAQEDHGASAWLLVRACSQNDVCGKALHGETKLACSLTLSLCFLQCHYAINESYYSPKDPTYKWHLHRLWRLKS